MSTEERQHKALLSSSSRVALAVFLRDMGKFAERAGIEVADSTLVTNKRLCPPRKRHSQEKDRFSRPHEAYTALAMGIIEQKFPALFGDAAAPFADWKGDGCVDSFLNVATYRKPESFLQWVIATADRLSSGFDHAEFERYNEAEEGATTGKNHYTARQLTLFEQVRLHSNAGQQYRYRYPLKALAPDSIFPVLVSECEQDDKRKARREYRLLWDDFIIALEKIPASHGTSWELWLDHFETLWETYAQAIPSATVNDVRSDVSLYDHSRVSAALAIALWRYHHEQGGAAPKGSRDFQVREKNGREEQFLLIQGDFFGIQDLIFAGGCEAEKRAANLLRGRSGYISLLTECAALTVLDALALPVASQVINVAGRFMIVAPNTETSIEALKRSRQRLSTWFLEQCFGQAGIALAWRPVCCGDFHCGNGGQQDSPYRQLIKKLHAQIEAVKLQRFQLCEAESAQVAFEDYLDRFDNELGVCCIDGKSPAQLRYDGIAVGALAKDQLETGHWLTRRQCILVTDLPLSMPSALQVPVFGYHIAFALPEEIQGKFGHEAKSGNLRRAWDVSLPRATDHVLWNGYARRAINAYVPLVDGQALADAGSGKYWGMQERLQPDDAKTLYHLACEDKRPQADGNWLGIRALTAFKGDVDNLGGIFENGLVDINFCQTVGLSRQLDAFFSVYLPWLCQADEHYRNTYIVFAGGDDFFMIGPWLSQIKLAGRLRQGFQDYVARNPELHFSAGLSTNKPGLPIAQVSGKVENALEKAKIYNPDNFERALKNAVTCFGQTMSWRDFDDLLNQRLPRLQTLERELGFGSKYVYGLLNLVDMAERVDEQPENALWYAYFAYRTAGMLDRQQLSRERRNVARAELAQEIAHLGIESHRGNYRIALFAHLYQRRD